MRIRAPILAVACAAVLAVVLPARADTPATSGSNEYSGRQSGSASTDTNASGSAVVDSNSNVPSADVSASDDVTGDSNVIVRTTLRRRSPTRSTSQTAETPEERVVTVTSTPFQRWIRGWYVGSTAQIGTQHSAPAPKSDEVMTDEVSTQPLRAELAPRVASPATITLASTEDTTTIRRQTQGLTGPPGPVGPEETDPIRVAPVVPAPATAAPAPAAVGRRRAREPRWRGPGPRGPRKPDRSPRDRADPGAR